jgi:hypothetical protein
MIREQGTGNREQGTGNREQGTGKLYFSLLTSVFFPFSYLVNNQLDTAVPGIMKYRY